MIYLFDGTKAGFLTAFLSAYLDEEAILASRIVQLPLGQTPVAVPTDEARVERAKTRLLSFDRGCIQDLELLLRSGKPDCEQVAFEYFRLLAKEKRPVRKRLAQPEVFKALEYIKKIRLEIHHFHGFIRFMETVSGALYAPFSPDNDICDLLLPHFRARLPQFPFVLHDIKRKKAAVYDGKNAFVAPLEKAELILSADETEWQTLWKRYYRAVNIPSRQRLKQMKGSMPVRYWKFLPETQTSAEDLQFFQSNR